MSRAVDAPTWSSCARAIECADHALAVLGDVRDPCGGEGRQHLLLVETASSRVDERGAHPVHPICELRRQLRMPGELGDRLLAPLAATVHGEHEALALEGLDQQVRDGLFLGAIEQLRVAGGEDHGGMRVIAPQLAGQPQAGLARHHDVDDGEVGVPLVQSFERLVGVARGPDVESQRRHPSRHQISHARFIVHDQHGGHGNHGVRIRRAR